MKTSQTNLTENTRLTIDVPAVLHRIIKAHATMESTSIKNYVLEALKEKLQSKTNLSKKELNKKTILALNEIGKKDKSKTFTNVASAMNHLTKEPKIS